MNKLEEGTIYCNPYLKEPKLLVWIHGKWQSLPKIIREYLKLRNYGLKKK